MLSSENNAIVMGILNCTPDSFFEGSRKQTEHEILDRAEEILAEGGSIIDIGAFSTRPGAQEVSEEEELRRMRNALSIIRPRYPNAVLSIDTFRPIVARMAVEEFGANIINDVSEGMPIPSSTEVFAEGQDAPPVPLMFSEVARLKVPYILMSNHKDMDAIIHYFQREVELLHILGVKDIILDPGFGFGKDVIQGNYAVLKELPRLRQAFPDLPILAGVSRKRMIYQVLGCSPHDTEAMHGTMLLNFMALKGGASILRVHDVKEAINTIKISNQVENHSFT